MTEKIYLKNYINGIWSGSDSNAYFEKFNPSQKSESLGLFPASNVVDVQNAILAARNCEKSWGECPSPSRGDLIFKLIGLYEKNRDLLAETIVREVGKTKSEALGEVQSSIDAGLFMASEGRRLYGQTAQSALEKRWALIKRVPVGVCGLITAWNAPLAIISWKIFPALICGNSVVLKPSEDAPMTAFLFSQLVHEAGFPPGVINVVFGKGHEVGECLVQNPEVKLVSFTGSAQIGRLISESCGKQMKKCSLELGGKNALIVLPDADLRLAAQAVVNGAFSVSGQRCASTSRAIVHQDIYDLFLAMVLEETDKLIFGSTSDPKTTVGPLINERQMKSVLDAIHKAKQDGCSIKKGGKVLDGDRYKDGYYVAPTILEACDPESRISQEEIFGPVLSMYRVDSLSEAIELLNNTPYGLTASIYTSNIHQALYAVEQIQTGVCYVNAPTFGSEPHMPFGGVKSSGNGTREPGTQSLDVFSEFKTVYIDYRQISNLI